MIAEEEATTYLKAVEHLPKNGTLLVHNVSWEKYESVLEEFERKPAHRVFYNDGVLKIVSPRPEREFLKDCVLGMVTVYADEFDIDVESYGSTTYRRRRKMKGAEPDTSFYVQHTAEMRARSVIDLEKDAPPDVVVEIDATNESLDKFEIYAALLVPEIWRFDGENFKIHVLLESSYVEVENSVALPLISAEMLTEFLNIAHEKGQTAMLKDFRKKLRKK
jgi:Uma2 family endonuclease